MKYKLFKLFLLTGILVSASMAHADAPAVLAAEESVSVDGTIAPDSANDTEGTENVQLSVTQINEKQLEIVITGLEKNTALSKENFEVIGFYSDSYGDYTHTLELKNLQYAEDGKLLLNSVNKLIKGFAYTVIYQSTESEESRLPVCDSFAFPKESEESPQEEKSTSVLLKNQEAIRVPMDASFADGTRLQNVRDIAKWAFSYMTSDGTVVVPTYSTNTTGVTDIAGVRYRANKGASMVIIQSVYLKVYLDADNDGWVTTAEKTTDALGYYIIKVDVDKTLTVEDWSMVTE